LENDIDWSQQLNHELNLCFSRDPVLEEFILLVNSSVKPTSSCLAFLEQAIRENPDADMIFGDEVVSDSGSWHKPGCSHALLLSQPYISSLLLLRRSLWLRVGGLREEFRDAAIYDLALRAIAASENIVHVPRILCEVERRWVVNELHRKASLDSCRQIGLNAKITSCDDVHVNRVSVSPKSTPRVSVIVPTRDSIDLLTVCIESVLDLSKNKELEVIIVDNGSKEPATLDRFELWRRERNVLILRSDCEFDYSALMNAAVSQSSAPLVTFLNNDTRIISPHWVDEMCGWLELDEVGAVGAKLYYGDETIQHAGVVLGVGAVASHAFKREKRNASGYNSLLRCARDVSAVTAAFMMTKRSLFLDVRGFDSSLRVAYNDVDYCLKLRSLGFRVIWTPEVECFHFEGKTRGKDTRGNVRFEEEISIMRAKWGNEIASDPFYNPNLSKSHVDFRPRVV
jgi:GT2 family glycosyltransferase